MLTSPHTHTPLDILSVEENWLNLYILYIVHVNSNSNCFIEEKKSQTRIVFTLHTKIYIILTDVSDITNNDWKNNIEYKINLLELRYCKNSLVYRCDIEFLYLDISQISL